MCVPDDSKGDMDNGPNDGGYDRRRKRRANENPTDPLEPILARMAMANHHPQKPEQEGDGTGQEQPSTRNLAQTRQQTRDNGQQTSEDDRQPDGEPRPEGPQKHVCKREY